MFPVRPPRRTPRLSLSRVALDAAGVGTTYRKRLRSGRLELIISQVSHICFDQFAHFGYGVPKLAVNVTRGGGPRAESQDVPNTAVSEGSACPSTTSASTIEPLFFFFFFFWSLHLHQLHSPRAEQRGQITMPTPPPGESCLTTAGHTLFGRAKNYPSRYKATHSESCCGGVTSVRGRERGLSGRVRISSGAAERSSPPPPRASNPMQPGGRDKTQPHGLGATRQRILDFNQASGQGWIPQPAACCMLTGAR